MGPTGTKHLFIPSSAKALYKPPTFYDIPDHTAEKGRNIGSERERERGDVVGNVSIWVARLGKRPLGRAVVGFEVAGIRLVVLYAEMVPAWFVHDEVVLAGAARVVDRGRRPLGDDHGVRVRRLGLHALLLLRLLRMYRLKTATDFTGKSLEAGISRGGGVVGIVVSSIVLEER